MENNFNWPLNVPQFTWKDKLKMAYFLLTDDKWTQGKHVSSFESEMASFVNCRYAVFVSSGSTANTILAMHLRDKGIPDKNIVVFPSTTWTTSVSPFIREGFIPEFIDINPEDYSIDLYKLEKFLSSNNHRVAAVFITSLIGYSPDLKKIKDLGMKYDVKIMMDNCENTLGKYAGENVSSYFTSTTSTYFGHQIQSVEGGFIFTNDRKEYEYFLMARNHGLTRALPESSRCFFQNEKVNPQFDFNMLGNNFRNSDIHAFIGRLDLARADEYSKIRKNLYNTFKSICDNDKFYFPYSTRPAQSVPFCLPIILKNQDDELLFECKKVCSDLKIETRPIISGNLLHQTCYAKYSKSPEDFKVSEYLHNFGFYVGLHSKVKKDHIVILANHLNRV